MSKRTNYHLFLTLAFLSFYINPTFCSDQINVISTSPADGAQHIPILVDVSIQLDISLGEACQSCNPKGVKVRLRANDERGPVVPSSIDLEDNPIGSLIRLYPNKPLSPDTLHYVIFEHKDQGDKTEFIWVFTTAVDGIIGGGDLVVMPALLEFWTHSAGDSDTRETLVANAGYGDLLIDSVTPPGNPDFHLFQESCSGKVLGYQQWCSLKVMFTSAENSVVTDVIQIQAGSKTESLKLVGRVVTETNFGITDTSRYLTRIAQGIDGRIFVTDSKRGVVHVLSPDLDLVDRWAGLVSPLGITTDELGRVFIGNKGRKNVQVFEASGSFLFDIDSGNIQMPNDMVIGPNGNLHVVDSLANLVKVYAPDGQILFNYGGPLSPGALSFPSAIAVSPLTHEIFIADQKNYNIKVFDPSGAFLRTIGRRIGSFGGWEGKFNQLQGLTVDKQGQVHVLDSFLNRVQVLNPTNGSFISSYGQQGSQAGEIDVGLDVLILLNGDSLISNSDNHRLERFPLIATP